jgi:predicted enzyme related to lactoylglutathione lyase
MQTSPSKLTGSRIFAACLAVVLSIALPVGCQSTANIDTSAMSFSPEPLVGKIVWNDLSTEDLDAARRFYGGLFGWTFDRSTGPDGSPYLLARSGRVYVAGIVGVRSHSDRWLPYASVDDVDVSVAKARAAGAKVPVAERNVSLGRIAVIVDPEGAVIGLARSHIGDPDDATTRPAAGRVVWTELLANNPVAATRFYETVVGYSAQTVQRRGGQYTLLSDGGKNRAGILQNPSDQAVPLWLTYFGVDDLQATVSRVEALGGKVVLGPSPQLREGNMALITDPTGALLALQKVNR